MQVARTKLAQKREKYSPKNGCIVAQIRIRIWRERYNKLPQLEVNENTMFAFYDGEDQEQMK